MLVVWSLPAVVRTAAGGADGMDVGRDGRDGDGGGRMDGRRIGMDGARGRRWGRGR